MSALDLRPLRPLQEALESHPVYASVRSLADLRVFMSHHVYSVWDFMSLVKSLQGALAPARVPWTPRADAGLRRFINQLVLEEESDELPPGPGGEVTYASHFELYCQALGEIGGDPDAPLRFVAEVEANGVAAALALPVVPDPARRFVRESFAFLDSGKAHVVAAALALGREQIIPAMFRGLLERMGVAASEAPAFHYYLHRHVHLDGDLHGPLSLRMLDTLCAGDRLRVREAEEAAAAALRARIAFWDGVHLAVLAARRSPAAAPVG